MQRIEITHNISAIQELILNLGLVAVSHSHQKCRQWNSNDVQEFFLGKKRTNLMVVRPILPVVESRSIEGGRLIGTPIFGRLHFFPYSILRSSNSNSRKIQNGKRDKSFIVLKCHNETLWGQFSCQMVDIKLPGSWKKPSGILWAKSSDFACNRINKIFA